MSNHNGHTPVLLLLKGPSGLAPAACDGSNNLLIAGAGGGGTSSNFNQAEPSVGTAIGVKDTATGNMVAPTATGGAINVNGTFSPAQSNTSTSPAQTSVGTSSVQLLAANASRKRMIIQNTGTTRLKLVLGATNATQTAYTRSLPACGTSDDGSSDPYIDDMWTGAVQAISSASGGTCVVTELT